MKIFVSYAHDDVGKRLEQELVGKLREHGYSVASDRDMPEANPASMQEWMNERVAEGIVLCVLSPDYVARFATGSGSSERRGVLFESRAIVQRLYEFTETDNCPIVPVALPDFKAEEAPPNLRKLVIARIDVGDDILFEKLIKRIVALENKQSGVNVPGGSSTSAVSAEPLAPTGTGRGVSRLRTVMHDLEMTAPDSAQALDLVREWLALSADPRCCDTWFVNAFPFAERVAKSTGDIRLMRELSDTCLRVLAAAEPKLKAEYQLEARVLICGRGWHLQRDHLLDEAMDVNKRGIQLAKKYEDARTEAFGKKCLGRIQRIMAEGAAATERDHFLRESVGSLEQAGELFARIAGVQDAEVGDCFSLEARTHLVRYQLTSDQEALRLSEEALVAAERILTPGTTKDYLDLVILKAELELVNDRFDSGLKLVGEAVEHLLGRQGAQYSEILARAYRVRATLRIAAQGDSGLEFAVRDFKRAVEIFSRLGQSHAAALCEWDLIPFERPAWLSLNVPREELDELARQARDPRERLDALRELDQQEHDRLGVRVATRAWDVNWSSILKKLRSRED